jgi:hypothetical protein
MLLFDRGLAKRITKHDRSVSKAGLIEVRFWPQSIGSKKSAV